LPALEHIMKRDIRRALLAMLMASASLAAMQTVHAAPGDPGDSIYGASASDKLLGAPDDDTGGYGDPYGTQGGGAAKGAGDVAKQNGQNNGVAPRQAAGTGAGPGMGSTMLGAAGNPQGDPDGQAAGAPQRKLGARAPASMDPANETPDSAAQAVYGMTGMKSATKKPTEVYRSPY
jgi:hypothetical protein